MSAGGGGGAGGGRILPGLRHGVLLGFSQSGCEHICHVPGCQNSFCHNWGLGFGVGFVFHCRGFPATRGLVCHSRQTL